MLVAGEQLKCTDDAVKAESTAAAEDLVDGKLPLQGTELFRYVTLGLRNAKTSELMPILEAVKSQPPAVAKEFLGTLRGMYEVRERQELARVPGRGNAIDLSADGKRLAIGMGDSRVAVMDLASGRFDLIATDLVESRLDADDSGITRIVWAGGNLLAADRGGSVYRIDPAAKKATALPVGSARNSMNAGTSLCVSRDGKWVAWLKSNQTLVIMAPEGGPVREVAVNGARRLTTGEEGLRITSNDGGRYVLKNADLASGQPALSDDNNPNWEEDPRRKYPNWRNLQLSGYESPERKNYDSDQFKVSIPTQNCYLISPDQTL